MTAWARNTNATRHRVARQLSTIESPRDITHGFGPSIRVRSGRGRDIEGLDYRVTTTRAVDWSRATLPSAFLGAQVDAP